jgi:Fe-S cluster assembly ATP-binding protein
MTNLLEIKDLCVAVDGQELLHHVNLTIPEGEVHTLLGPNGSGKTSLIMTIMGFSAYKVTHGQILFEGKEITELDLTERARLGISVAQQRPPTLAGVKLQQVLDYTAARVPEQAAEMDMLVKNARMERFLNRNINQGLSGGEIKRSELLQLLVGQPRLAMMDEPDSGVDVESLSIVGNMINDLFSWDGDCQAKRRAGLIITHTGHILDYVPADKAHIMLNGSIGCSGNPHLILNIIREHGYEECVRCIQEGVYQL